MDRIGGTINNVVFRQVKSGQTIIYSAEDFCETSNQFCPSITMLFEKSDVILSVPSDIEEAQIIPGTLNILRFPVSHDVLPLRLEKLKSIFSSNRKERNLVVPKNTSPKRP